MNLNENVLNSNRAKSRMRLNKAAFGCRNQFVKPALPKPRKKLAKSSTTSSSTPIHWGGPKNTAQSSTTGSSSKTSTTSGDENHVVLALTEGRGNATSEVGMAVINLDRPSMILCQLSDTKNYIKTLTKINILNPTEIIVPTTFIEGRFQNRLTEKVRQQFSHVKITGIARNVFNKENGSEQIKKLCLPQCNAVILTVQHKYYCVSAASALLAYIANMRNIYYATKSVKIAYEESEESMIIDISAADNLELVANERIVEPGQKSTLLGILNYCFTRVGTRTLRATILQPPSCVTDIEQRLDCITLLQSKPETLAAIQAILMKLSNVDQILSLATLIPESLKSYSERQLNYILLLNLTLDQIEPLKEIFEDAEEQFFLELRETLNNPSFSNLKQLITKTIKNDAYPAKGSNAIMQRCFAIKPGVNGLLDTVRKTYSDLLDAMRAYVADLGKKYGLSLTLSNNNKKGFHMVLGLTPQQRRTMNKTDLPQEFIQVCRMTTCFTMKTEELTTYSVRIEDVTANILQISNSIIRGLIMEIKNNLDIFYKLVEDIAKLDVLQSLAEASSGKEYVRPHFADYTDIVNAKHPILDVICSKEPVANPIQVSSDYNMHIITGPNGSGKSIFIRQVALIQIMAQVGSYVPATSATLRVCDRLFTRISLNDNMECNISSFELELLEIKNFLTTMTKNSLVIIDELCRSTAVEEGTALAMAICEKMLQTPAFIFLTTHYTLITRLQELYCNIKVWQMEASVTGTDVTNTKLILKYNLIPGCTSLKRYSIYLIAKMWPENIVRYIESVVDDLEKTQAPKDFEIEGVSAKRKLIYEVKAEFESLKRKNQLTKATINTILNKYQRQLQEFGVKIVHEGETSESENEAAHQVTDENVPEDTDKSNSGNYESGNENEEILDYLVPDVSLRESSGENVNNICSPSESSANISYKSGQSAAQQGKKSFEPFELSPIQSVVGSQRISQARILSQVGNRNISQQFLDAAQTPSLGDPCCSKYLTPEENLSFTLKSPAFFIQKKKTSLVPTYSSQAGIRTSSPFVYQSSKVSRQFFVDAPSCSSFARDKEIYLSPTFFDGAQQNSSSEFFENVPPGGKSTTRNTSLNQLSFNNGLSGNVVKSSTPLNVVNQEKEGADEALIVNRTKSTKGSKEAPAPLMKNTKSTFGKVHETKKKGQTDSSSSVARTASRTNSPFIKNKSTEKTFETKKVKRSAFDFEDQILGTSRIIQEASTSSISQAHSQDPADNDKRMSFREKSNSPASSINQEKLIAVSSQRKSHASTSFSGNSTPIPDKSKSVHRESFSSTNQTKILEKQDKINALHSCYGNSKASAKSSAERSRFVHNASISSMNQATSLEDGKQSSFTECAEKSDQNVSSSSQLKLTPTSFERKNISTLSFGNLEPFPEKTESKSKFSRPIEKQITRLVQSKTSSPASLFHNVEPVAEDFGEQSTDQSIHERKTFSVNQAKVTIPSEKRIDASSSLFGNSNSVEEFYEAASSCASQVKLGTTPPQKETRDSALDLGSSKLLVPDFKDQTGFKRTPASGILKPIEVDFEKKLVLANKSLDERSVPSLKQAKDTTSLGSRADAPTSDFGGSKSAERLKDVLEAPSSRTSQSKLRAASVQKKRSASTPLFDNAKTFVTDVEGKSKDAHEPHTFSATQIKLWTTPSGYLEPIVDFGKMSTLSNRNLERKSASSTKVATPLEKRSNISNDSFGSWKLAKRPKSFHETKPTKASVQREIRASTLFLGSPKQFEQTKAKPTPISLEKSVVHVSSSYADEEPSFGAIHTSKRAVAGTSSSIYCTPNEHPNDSSTTSSLDCSKFIAGLTRTSTPLIQKEDTPEGTSISYSPLCPSPPKILPPTTRKRLGVRPNKFIPPNKLTKRQIQEDYAEQTRKMMESDDPSKFSEYAQRIRNRPTVQQLQQSEHIASIKRTGEGVVVIPVTEGKKSMRRRKFAFNVPQKVFEPKLLSDENEEKFMEFLERSKKSETEAGSSSSNYVPVTPKDFSYYQEQQVEVEKIVNMYLQPQEKKG